MSERTDWIERWALYAPNRVALCWDPTDRDITYTELNRLGAFLARRLTDGFGLKRGDRLAVLAQNTLEHVLLFVAAQKAGWILVPLNFRMAAPEIAYALEDSDPALFIHQRAYEPMVASLRKDSGLPATLLLDGEESLETLLEGVREVSLEGVEGPGFEDPVMILYTSGSTGRPKGALITHRMLAFNAVNTALSVDLCSSDVSFNAAPLYHTGGWNVLTTPLLFHGGTVLMLDGFDADRLLELCGEGGITILWGVPTMLRMMAESPLFETADLSTVRCALVGGEPMPGPLIEVWHEKGIPVRQGFGMTEVGPNCFSLSAADAVSKVGSIGRPNFYIDTRLVDDEGLDVAPGEIGELWMRGPVVTPGYWRNPEANAKAFHEGWFATGDLMRCDEGGFFRVVGRKKEMFISGGENVYPAEVERALLTHDAVSQAAVVGVSDAVWGEVGAAFVVLSGAVSEAALVAHCRARLAGYKVPRSLSVIDAMPLGSSGKIDKNALVSRALHRV